MRKLLVVLAVVSMAAPALAQTDFFKVTADGSFNITRTSEGYTNNGQQGVARICKANQNMGWMSWYGAVGDNSAQSLGAYIAANGGLSNVVVKLHFRTDGTGDTTGKMAIESLRSGNIGPMVEDVSGGGVSMATPANGFAGSSQFMAFRASAVPAGGFTAYGQGIYTNNLKVLGGGTPWIAPTGRTAGTGRNGFLFGAGDAIEYDVDGDGTNGLTGLFDGYNQDGAQGANFHAVEDLLGLRQNNGTASGGAAQVYGAGQLLVGGQATPTLFNPLDATFNDGDPRRGTTDPNWKVVTFDSAFVNSMITDAESFKGIVFTSRITGVGVDTFANTGYYTKDQGGGAWAPYLEVSVVPEPATMCLLALGGLALLRRRA